MSASISQRRISQHYVPQGYLRPFCGPNQRLWAFDKRTDRVFATGTTTVGCENNFYEISDEAATDPGAQEFKARQMGEAAMCAFESDFYRVRDLLLSEGPFVGISSDVRLGLASAIAVQFLRTRSMRDSIINWFEAGGTDLAQEIARRNFGEGSENDIRLVIDPAFHSVHHLHLILEPDRRVAIGQALHDHAWILARATGGKFHTSDCPVVRQAHVGDKLRPGTGFQSPGIEVIFPLSPAYALIIRERSFHKEFARLDGTVQDFDEEQVAYCNQLQVASAYRFVFSATDDFSTEQTLLAKNPHLRDKSLVKCSIKRGRERRNGKEIRQITNYSFRVPTINF